MSRLSHLLRGAIGLGAIVGIAACGDADKMVLGPVTPTGGAIFKNYVAVGHSIPAGWQSGGLNDSTQRAAYPNLFAIQAGTRFAYPSFPKSFTIPIGLVVQSGCPAPTGNWFSQKLVDSLVPTPGGCDLRDPTKATDLLNDVAVPYAYAGDLTTTGPAVTIPGNGLNTLILGGLSQVDRATRADPTFISFEVGDNEILSPATVGLLGGYPPAGAPGLVGASVEIPLLKKALDALVAGSPHLMGGIIIGVVRVTNAPRFFPADTLGLSVTRKTQFDAFTGRGASTVIACGTGVKGWLISSELPKAIRNGAHPNVVSCVKNAPAAPIGDIFMLDPVEVQTLNDTTDAYNVYLKAKADTLKWAYLDPNVLLAAARTGTTPPVPAYPTLTSTTAPFGAVFSLDGVHPTAAGQKLIANAMIDSVNSKYGTKLLKVP